jgi:crossover junction endodeoxyribonuclease RuvC
MPFMRILGIDPGLGRVGFGLLEVTSGRYERAGGLSAGPTQPAGPFGPCEWGIIATSKDKPTGARLQEIYQDMRTLVEHTRPDAVSIERLFYFRNATTLVPVAQARGVILLVIDHFGLPVYEYTPMQVKQAVTGSGKSKKGEVQDLLITLLALDRKPTPDDAADALALAVCHYNHAGCLAALAPG